MTVRDNSEPNNNYNQDNPLQHAVHLQQNLSGINSNSGRTIYHPLSNMFLPHDVVIDMLPKTQEDDLLFVNCENQLRLGAIRNSSEIMPTLGKSCSIPKFSLCRKILSFIWFVRNENRTRCFLKTKL